MIQRWVDKTVAEWGKVDCLLVNAGGPPAKTVKEMTDADWQAAFELTLLSSVRMIAAALPHMGAGGSILTVTSGSVREPIPRLALSTVMRAGVAGLVKTLADELAGGWHPRQQLGAGAHRHRPASPSWTPIPRRSWASASKKCRSAV